MNIEKEYYVLTTVVNGEVLYLTEKYSFDNDITVALKAKNILVARFLREDIELKRRCCLKIIPIKVTYELKLEDLC